MLTQIIDIQLPETHIYSNCNIKHNPNIKKLNSLQTETINKLLITIDKFNELVKVDASFAEDLAKIKKKLNKMLNYYDSETKM